MDSSREKSGIVFYAARSATKQTPRAVPLRDDSFVSQSKAAEIFRAQIRGGTLRRHLNPAKVSYQNKPVAETAQASVVMTEQYLPLTDVIADVKVTGSNSQTTITQVFFNSADRAIPESTYFFPLYDGSTVISFNCRIGSGPEIKGIVKAKEEARAIYNKAVADKKVGTLLDEETPEIFQCSIAHIPPNTGVSVQITYLNELKPDICGDGHILTIPTSVAPRYGRAPTPNFDSSLLRREKLDGDGLKIRVEVAAEHEIRELICHTHPTSYHIGAPKDLGFASLVTGVPVMSELDHTKGKIEFIGSTAVLDRDFVLHIKTDRGEAPQYKALLEHSSQTRDTSALQVTFSPGDLFAKEPVLESDKTEVIFVLDRSASMSFEKIETLRKAVFVLLEQLQTKNQKCQFNICSFGSSSAAMWPRSKSCAKENIDAAINFLSGNCNADMGGTELRQGLEKAVSVGSTDKNVKTQIITLTDGELWDRENVMDFIKQTREKSLDHVRFFALGIGNEVSHSLVEGIGRNGGGFTNVLPSTPNGDWKSGVVRILDGAFAPGNWECTMSLRPRFDTMDEYDADPQDISVSYTQAPFHIPSMHAFETSTVYFLFDSSDPPIDEIVIEGTSSDGRHARKAIPITHVQTPCPIIHHLAAKAVITDLEEGGSELYENSSADRAAISKKARDQAVHLGTRWNIAGKYTSFVGVETETGTEKMAVRIYKPEVEVLDLMAPNAFDPWSFLPKRPSLPWTDHHFNDDDDGDDDENDDKDDDSKKSGSRIRGHSCKTGQLNFFQDQDDDDVNSGGGSGSSGSNSGRSARSSNKASVKSSKGTSYSSSSGSGGNRGSSGRNQSKHARFKRGPKSADEMRRQIKTRNWMEPLRLDTSSPKLQPRYQLDPESLVRGSAAADDASVMLQLLMREQNTDGSFDLNFTNEKLIRHSFHDAVFDDIRHHLRDEFAHCVTECTGRYVKDEHRPLIHRNVESWIETIKGDGSSWKSSLEALLKDHLLENSALERLVNEISVMYTAWNIREETICTTTLAAMVLSKWSRIYSGSPVVAECLRRADDWLSAALKLPHSKEKLFATSSRQFLHDSMSCLSSIRLESADFSQVTLMTKIARRHLQSASSVSWSGCNEPKQQRSPSKEESKQSGSAINAIADLSSHASKSEEGIAVLDIQRPGFNHQGGHVAGTDHLELPDQDESHLES